MLLALQKALVVLISIILVVLNFGFFPSNLCWTMRTVTETGDDESVADTSRDRGVLAIHVMAARRKFGVRPVGAVCEKRFLFAVSAQKKILSWTAVWIFQHY